MKNISFFFLFYSGLLFSQDVLVISNDSLSGHYIDFAHGGEDRYYALSQNEAYYTFDLTGNIISKTELDCGFVCEIYDMEVGPDGNLYFATRSGVFVEGEDGSFNYLFGPEISDIAFGLEGEIYCVGNLGSSIEVGIYKDEEFISYTSENSIIESNNMHDVQVDSKGNAWFGGFDGLYKYSNNELALVFDEPVGHIHIDSNDIIYLSKLNGGLLTFNPTINSVTEVNWMDAQGSFFSGHANGNMYAAEYGKLHFFDGSEWRTLNNESFGFPDKIQRGGFMDPDGNFFLSLDDTNEIIVFRDIISSTTEINIDFKMSPNPASDLLHVNYEYPIEQLTILDLQGQKLLTKKVNADASTINLNTIDPGTYFVVITSNNKVGRRKLIIH